MENINGFEIVSDWCVVANGEHAKARKDGKTYFIKKLSSPSYPPSFLDKEVFQRNKKACDEWFTYRRRIVESLRDGYSECPMIMSPIYFFLEKQRYYVVSELIREKPMSFEEISRCSDDEKMDLMRRYMEVLANLQKRNIVHGDLKADNVLTVRRKEGLVPLFIDFEDCFMSGKPPSPEMTCGSPEYYSPELGRYIVSEDERGGDTVTCKSDVFAAGLMLHQYWTGKVVPHAYKYCYQAEKNSDLRPSGLPADLEKIIKMMLEVDPSKRIDARTALANIDRIMRGEKVSDGSSAVSIVQVGTDTYKVTKTDGSTMNVVGAVAEYLAKTYKVSIVPMERGSTAKKPAKSDVEIIEERGSNVKFRGSDGVIRTLPKAMYDILLKEGKL